MTEHPDLEEQIKEIRKQADRIRLKRMKLGKDPSHNPNAVVLEVPKGSFHDDQKENSTSKSKASTIKSNPTGKSCTSSSFLVAVDPSVISMVHNDESEIPEDGPDRGSKRQSDLCCGSCCDLVKASVLTNAGFVCMLSFLMTVSLLELPYFYLAFKPNSSKEYYDDDIYEDAFFDGQGRVALMRTCAGILFGLVGMVGAARFEKWAVLCTSIGYILYAMSSILQKSVPHAVIAGFVTYPNVALFMALRSGTMTKEAYMSGREAKCCCRSDNNKL